MDFFDILTMLGGLALFLYGMDTMGQGLEKLSGGRLERVLEGLTSSRLKAVLLGAVVTGVIQSSSATTVMVVGFVNSGIMKLSQAVGVIMGANIGTTLTSWLLSLTGIEGGNFFVRLMKPSSFSPILALAGVFLVMFSGREKKKDLGSILVGFAILMFGMDTMSGAVKPLADVPEFIGILTMFSHPLLGLLAGTILTAVIQSSSASVGILQALCATGAVSYSSAVPIIMGQNIGTCVTALLSAVGASKNARRASLVHLYFNIIGTAVFMAVFYMVHAVVELPFMGESANAVGIAVVHSLFNITATLILLPFSDVLVRLACLTVPERAESADEPEMDDTEAESAFRLLDVRFLETPGYAVEQCRQTAVRMARLSQECLLASTELLKEYDTQTAERVAWLESLVDRYEDELGTYMVKLGGRKLSVNDSRTISLLLHCISDFERISDHGMNVMIAAGKMEEKKMEFSRKARKELRMYLRAVQEDLETAVAAFENNDLEQAFSVEPLTEVIDGMHKSVKANHVKRLQKGKCSVEQGFVLSDITDNLGRVADHCSNIAVSVMEIERDGLDAHGYLGSLKRGNDERYNRLAEYYRRKYTMPE